MMSFLGGRVVHDKVDSDFTASAARARPRCAGAGQTVKEK
jgi:hypothetical protein